jgi:hypothetical protein
MAAPSVIDSDGCGDIDAGPVDSGPKLVGPPAGGPERATRPSRPSPFEHDAGFASPGGSPIEHRTSLNHPRSPAFRASRASSRCRSPDNAARSIASRGRGGGVAVMADVTRGTRACLAQELPLVRTRYARLARVAAGTVSPFALRAHCRARIMPGRRWQQRGQVHGPRGEHRAFRRNARRGWADNGAARSRGEFTGCPRSRPARRVRRRDAWRGSRSGASRRTAWLMGARCCSREAIRSR